MNRQFRFLTVLVASGALGGLALTGQAAPKDAGPPLAKATFAGGCFWSEESAFDKVEGVVSTTSGYAGGQQENPTYEQVSSGGTGHVESVEVAYDPTKVTYARLLEVFWHNVDPLDASGQFCDHGDQYHSAIFVRDEEQRRLAEESKRQLEASGRFKQPLATRILPAQSFYPAEGYHQDYARKNPLQYRLYRSACGRDARLKELWGEDAGK
ncbi:peptide-methionine (S)-S-oxide reductase MsrA [Archangium sp.]|uniref:peptide-methionine (S)-S-oxide reductase MsrA n=1 Tax=Archangium sp. TaxID=1872627 RepID=UPI003899AA57